jgi:hypothetical protein
MIKLDPQEGLLLQDYVTSAINLMTAKLLRELDNMDARTKLNLEKECENYKQSLIELISEVTECEES